MSKRVKRCWECGRFARVACFGNSYFMAWFWCHGDTRHSLSTMQ